MKLNPAGLSGDQEQLSEDQLHAEGSFASLAFSKEPIDVLKSSVSTAALLQVTALLSKRVASSADGEEVGAAKALAAKEMIMDSFIVKVLGETTAVQAAKKEYEMQREARELYRFCQPGSRL